MRYDTQALEAFERDLFRRNQAPRSIYVQVAFARRFLKTTEKPLAKITTADLRSYLALRRAEDIAALTHRTEVYRLRAFFGVLFKLGVIDADPAAPLQVKTPPRTVRHHLAQKAVKELLLAASRTSPDPTAEQATLALRDRACLELLYGLGLRASEVRTIRVVDLDLHEGNLLVRRAKRGESRLLPLPPSSLPHLRCYLVQARPYLAGSRRRDQGHFLITRRGKPLHRGAIGRIVNRVAKRVDISAHPHAFRRALSTHLSQAGVNIGAIQLLLGHKNVATTSVYIGLDPEELRVAVEGLDP
jgi:site-specific recombinase XerD